MGRAGFVAGAFNTQNLQDLSMYPYAGPQIVPKMTGRLWISIIPFQMRAASSISIIFLEMDYTDTEGIM